MNQIKKCRVCGDIATGFNYGALSCESCKVFFCRNSSRIEKFHCVKEANCEINISTRSKCLKCRLIKCFAIGMKKIMSLHNVPDHSSIHSSLDHPKIATGAELMLEISILSRITDYDIKQMSNYISNNRQQLQMQTTTTTTKRNNNSIELNQYELVCLEQARNVFRHEPNPVITKHATSARDYFDSLQLNSLVYLKKAIHFCHNFGAFNCLSSADQLAILKPFSSILTPIWAIFYLKLKTNAMLVATNEPETEATLVPNEIVFEYCKGNEALAKSYKYFIRLNTFMENDVNIRDLITTLMLFRAQQNVSSQENIRYHHYLYSLLLQRYMQSKHRNRKQGNRKYVALMRLLEQLDTEVEAPKRAFTSEIGVANLPEVVRELNGLV